MTTIQQANRTLAAKAGRPILTARGEAAIITHFDLGVKPDGQRATILEVCTRKRGGGELECDAMEARIEHGMVVKDYGDLMASLSGKKSGYWRQCLFVGRLRATEKNLTAVHAEGLRKIQELRPELFTDPEQAETSYDAPVQLIERSGKEADAAGMMDEDDENQGRFVPVVGLGVHLRT